MNQKLIALALLIFNLSLCYGQHIGSHLIGSGGESAVNKCGILFSFSIGEPIADFYKCHDNYRIGFIQSMPVLAEPEKTNGIKLPTPKVARPVSNRSMVYSRENERYVLFDAAGRILHQGVNFRKDDPTIYVPMTGIYFLQTSMDNKNVRIEKIMISR
jgi:hypothetical protein